MLNIGTKNIDTIYFIVSSYKFSRNISMKKAKAKKFFFISILFINNFVVDIFLRIKWFLNYFPQFPINFCYYNYYYFYVFTK